MAMRNAYYSAAGNGPGISRPAPGDLGPSFGQTYIDSDRLMLPFVLLDCDFKSGAIGHFLTPLFSHLPWPVSRKAGRRPRKSSGFLIYYSRRIRRFLLATSTPLYHTPCKPGFTPERIPTNTSALC
jgi:hypothetical protein